MQHGGDRRGGDEADRASSSLDSPPERVGGGAGHEATVMRRIRREETRDTVGTSEFGCLLPGEEGRSCHGTARGGREQRLTARR